MHVELQMVMISGPFDGHGLAAGARAGPGGCPVTLAPGRLDVGEPAARGSPPPTVVTSQTVTATRHACGTVTVAWTIHDSQRRDANMMARAVGPGAGGPGAGTGPGTGNSGHRLALAARLARRPRL